MLPSCLPQLPTPLPYIYIILCVSCFGRTVLYVYWEIQRSWFARVNALCNLSRKKSREVAAHFWADFCEAVELQSSTNANTVAVAKITMERGWRMKKKCLCVVLGRIRKSWVHRKKAFLGIPKHKQQVIFYFQTYDYVPQKMPLTLAV